MAGFEKRSKRYPTDLTDKEWLFIQPFLPPAPKRGRKPTTDPRDVLDALRCLARTGGGCQMLPNDFPPWQTVYWWFRRFVRRLLFRTIHDVALMLDRERENREQSPTAAVVERTFGWMTRWKRLLLDYEQRLDVSEAMYTSRSEASCCAGSSIREHSQTNYESAQFKRQARQKGRVMRTFIFAISAIGHCFHTSESLARQAELLRFPGTASGFQVGLTSRFVRQTTLSWT